MIDLSTFPYKDVFEKIEGALLKEGSREISIEKIQSELSHFKTIQFIQRTDEEYYQLIVMVGIPPIS